MRKHALWLKLGILTLIVGGLAVGAHTTRSTMQTQLAYKAKMLCSAIFVSRRNPRLVLREDLSVDGYDSLRNYDSHIDRGGQRVNVSFKGWFQRPRCLSGRSRVHGYTSGYNAGHSTRWNYDQWWQAQTFPAGALA